MWVFLTESMLVADAAGSVGWLVCAPCICEGGGHWWCGGGMPAGNESWRVNHFPLSTGRGPAALGR